MSVLTHRLVLCADANCFVFWDLPGDVLAAPELALCGWIGVIRFSLSLFLSMEGIARLARHMHTEQQLWARKDFSILHYNEVSGTGSLVVSHLDV